MLHMFYYRGPKRYPFTEIHLAAIMTAHDNGGFQKIVLHEDTCGDTWAYEEARKLPYVEFRKTEFPTELNGHRVYDQRIPVDYVRLQTLVVEGGVASDMDFIFLRDFTPLLNHGGFIGTQCKQKKKLVCALMYAKEPQNPFFIAYLEAYKNWQSIHETKFWTFANTIPYELSEKHPIEVLPVKAFYPVAWSNKTFLDGGDIKVSDSYAVHLWGYLKPALLLEDLKKTVISGFLPVLKERSRPSKQQGVTLTFD